VQFFIKIGLISILKFPTSTRPIRAPFSLVRRRDGDEVNEELLHGIKFAILIKLIYKKGGIS
jgi:hypothetical protein